jgi:hypothetical protein
MLTERSAANIPVHPEVEEQARRGFRSSRPILHRFNDLVGFAEVYWDCGTRIMVDYYFRRGRTRYYGVARSMVEIARIHPTDSAESKRQAILRALEDVQKTASEASYFVDTSPERAIVQTLDVDAFFAK